MVEIKVVGPGCKNCNKLEMLCNEVVLENKIDAKIEKVSDLERMTELGIMMTPGLIINGEVVSQRKIPVKATLLHWIKDRM